MQAKKPSKTQPALLKRRVQPLTLSTTVEAPDWTVQQRRALRAELGERAKSKDFAGYEPGRIKEIFAEARKRRKG